LLLVLTPPCPPHSTLAHDCQRHLCSKDDLDVTRTFH
jgi:hypothetical protein